MTSAAKSVRVIREEILRDPRFPVHQISDKLLPYLRVLVEEFHPREVILFGSYAYGQPDEGSDVDLLIVKPIKRTRLQDKLSIRSAWWPILMSGSPLSFDLLLSDPEEHTQRRQRGSAYYKEITERGLRLV